MTSIESAKPESNEPSAFRLVIRAEIIPEPASQTSIQPHANRRALAVVIGGLALLALSWIGFSVFRSDSASTPAVEEARDLQPQLSAHAPAQSEAAPVIKTEPTPKPASSATGTAAQSVEHSSPGSKSVESESLHEPDAAPLPITEVIPDVPQSALQTIRGTIRVSVRVTVDKQGAVIAATSTEAGPSRYFERLAIKASKKWLFTPAETGAQRKVLVRFNFTREGVTARASPV